MLLMTIMRLNSHLVGHFPPKCYYSVTWIGMSGGRIKLDLDSIPEGYGLLTMLPLGDLLNYGYRSNDHCPNYFW